MLLTTLNIRKFIFKLAILCQLIFVHSFVSNANELNLDIFGPIPEGVYYCFTGEVAGIQLGEDETLQVGKITPSTEKFLIKVFYREKKKETFECPENRPDLGDFCRANYFAKLPESKTDYVVSAFKSEQFGIPSKYGNSLYSYEGKIFKQKLTTLWMVKMGLKNSKFEYRLSILTEHGGYIETGECELFNSE